MRRIFIVFLILAFGYSFLLANMLAIREDGRTVILKDNNTWELEPRSTEISDEIPPEQTLFRYAMQENLYEHYLEIYEGDNLRNTIIVCYNIINGNNTTRMFSMEKETLKKYLLKGIQYTLEYSKIFVLPHASWGSFYYNLEISNLMFFWEYANILEDEQNYIEALQYYSQLKDLFIQTGEKFQYDFTDSNSCEEIDAKIYKMKLLSKST